MRIVRHITIIAVWTLLGLYGTLIILTHIPAFQSFLGAQVASALGQKLGTHVSIGRVDIGFLNRLIIDDVCIEDQQRKEMLKAARLSVKLDILPLTEGKISISTAQLFGAHAVFYQSSATAKPNFQFVLDSLASKDTTGSSPLNLRINSLIMRHSSIAYDRYDLPQTAGRLNLNHLKLTDISAHIILKTLTNDSLNANVKKLAFNEQSGLAVERMVLRVNAGRQNADLLLSELKLPQSTLKDLSISARYQLKENRLHLPSLSYEAGLHPSTITLSDLAFLVPKLKAIGTPVQLAAALSGEGTRMRVKSLTANAEDGGLDLHIDGAASQLDSTPQWEATVRTLAVSDKTLRQIADNWDMPPLLARIEGLRLTGTVSGKGTQSVATNSTLNTGIGELALNLALTDRKDISGSIATDGFQLGRLLDNDKVGMLATHIRIDGNLEQTVAANGVVDKIAYNGYTFQNITLEGTADNGQNLSGRLSIDDPNIQLAAEGSLTRASHINNVKVDARIQHLAPAAINLSNQWGSATFDADIKADFTASTLNDAQGTFDIGHLVMHTDETTYTLDQLHVESGFADDLHYVRLKSDFAEAEMKGYFEYGTLAQSFTNFIGSKLPTLPGLPKFNPNARNNFSLTATIQKTDWLQHLLNIPVTIAQPLQLTGTVNDAMHHITLNSDIPQFSYNGSPYTGGHIMLFTPNDSLQYNIGVTKIMDNGDHLDLLVIGNAANNFLSTSFFWDNHAQKRMSGQLNAKANFYTDIANEQTAFIALEPSHINVHNAVWDVAPSEITYQKKHLDIKQFSIKHDEQYLIIDGVASERPTDSLLVSLKDIDVDYVLNLVNFHAVEFSGQATGNAYVSNAFGNPQAAAQLTVSHFEFEHGRMGTLKADVNWNQTEEQIDIDATADDGEDAMTYISGYVSPKRDFIDLGIRAEGTHIDFMHSFTQSFISRVDGHANGAVRLMGPLSTINLTGQLVVNGEATVTPLNCTYTLRNDTIVMVPDEIEFRRCPIYDVYQHSGIVTGNIHHKHLTQLSYDLFVNADNLLAYDFGDFGEGTFYGTVFGTGDVDIHGRSGEVVINMNVTPQKNTVFVYNASNPDAINKQEFIQWGEASAATAEDGERAQRVEPLRDIGTNIYLNFLINCTPDATMRLLMDSNTNDYITLNGNGVIRASFYNKGAFNMYGTYNVERGTYGITIQEIIKKNFTFNQGGTIAFGGDPYDATLNLQAVHTVNGVSLSDLNVGRSFANTVRVNCLMNIGGQAKAPRVEFDLDIPNVNSDEQQMIRSIINGQEEMNQQVVYLLGIGRFYPQGANNASSQDQSSQSQTSLAMQSLLSGTLSGQINNVLNSVIKSNDWNFGANISTGDEGWNNAEYEGLVSGRLLNNRLLIDGQFGYRDNAATATTSFIGDFDIRYLLLPNGNLALKVYNQTNDRYFTRSSLNTQGIGLIMKKDFSGLRDLFSSGKKKQKKKAKKQQK